MNKGQTIIEYVIIIGIVIAALYAMGPAIKRGAQTVVKASADQLGQQNASDQDFGVYGSRLSESTSASKFKSNRSVAELGGETTTIVTEQTNSFTNSETSMGFQQ